MNILEPKNFTEKIINSSLKPISAIYYSLNLVRLALYKTQLKQQKKLPVPVISIGNLTVGGTGKTPLTIELAKSLVKLGYKTAILSRGYNRKSKEESLLVSDGNNIYTTVEESGDEPFLMAQSQTGAIIIVGSNRYKSGLKAIQEHGAQVILLDDGFQHLPLYRDLDIVIYDYNDSIQDLSLLPTGRLREPLASLARADLLIISKIPNNVCAEKISKIKQTAYKLKPQIPILNCTFKPKGIYISNSINNRIEKIETNNLRVFAFCAIAKPNGFIQSLNDTGAIIVGKYFCSDHHWLTKEEEKKLLSEFQKSKAQYLVTTQKDRVRFSQEFLKSCPTAELIIEIDWLSKPLVEIVTQKLNLHSQLVSIR